MATTQAQRASLYNTMAELMGAEDAETLMQQLPPGGWDQMATKDDIRVLGATITAALAESSAQASKERAEIITAFSERHSELVVGLAEAAKERAEIIKVFSERHAEAAKERVEIITAFSERHAEAAKERVEIREAFSERHSELVVALAEAAKERAEIIKSQAKHLYITVSTIVLATISIWIALLAGPAGG